MTILADPTLCQYLGDIVREDLDSTDHWKLIKAPKLQ